MRRLLYVPLMHEEADLGSVGKLLAQETASFLPEERRAFHRRVLHDFWQTAAASLRSLGPQRLRLYQDGLPADGPVGRRIVEEAARQGSQNYQLILELLDQGAELRKTEDPALLLGERQNILRFAQQVGVEPVPRDVQEYRRQRDRLLAERDAFIGGTINATLREGELGVLFLGAQHDVASHLARDVVVEAVKDREKVQAYFAALLSDQSDEGLEELARELISPGRAL
jgi:hypothetical protein